MIPVLVGLSSALIFGAADFFGGLAARRIQPLRVTFIAAIAGLALMSVAAPLSGGAVSGEALLWGGLSGLSGGFAIVLLYAALAIGPMSILSPLTAVISAIVPMTWGLLGGETLTGVGYLALGLALVAVVLVGFVPEKGAVRPHPRGILYAVGSGILIGVFLVIMDQTPDDSGLVPLLANRAASVVFLGALILVLMTRARRGTAESTDARSGWRAGLGIALICGILDATANAMILFGLRLGDLSVMSVLVALYPAGTILLAGILLGERIAPVQWAGLALAVAAAAMLGSHRELSAMLALG